MTRTERLAVMRNSTKKTDWWKAAMADLGKKSDKEKEKAEVMTKRPGPGDDADAPAGSSDIVIDKMIKVLELLDERMQEL
jgi:hypothetical protein